MKDLFKSFTSPSDDAILAAWKSDQTIFVFDTNVFLNLYGFEQQTRKDFFSTVQKIEDKIWIPFHVGLEFHNQRLNVISREKKIFQDLNDITERLLTKLKGDLSEHKLQTKFPKIQELSEQLASSIESAINDFKTKIDPWDKKQPGVRSNDEVLEKIYKITEGRVGPPPKDQEWLDALYLEGSTRYEKRIPPGFKDTGKDHINNTTPLFFHNDLSYQRKFGDLIIWKQILQHVSAAPVKNVFFITDDAKEDWWAIMKSSGSKVIGPHEALRREIYNTPSVELFHMYSTSDFLSNAQKSLRIKLHESSINDIIKSQAQRIKDFDLELNDRIIISTEAIKDYIANQEHYARLSHIYPHTTEHLAENLRVFSISQNSNTLSEAQSELESIKASTAHLNINRLQEINNKELEKILRHNQMLDSIRDSNQAHFYNVYKSAVEEDDDEPS